MLIPWLGQVVTLITWLGQVLTLINHIQLKVCLINTSLYPFFLSLISHTYWCCWYTYQNIQLNSLLDEYSLLYAASYSSSDYSLLTLITWLRHVVALINAFSCIVSLVDTWCMMSDKRLQLLLHIFPYYHLSTDWDKIVVVILQLHSWLGNTWYMLSNNVLLWLLHMFPYYHLSTDWDILLLLYFSCIVGLVILGTCWVTMFSYYCFIYFLYFTYLTHLSPDWDMLLHLSNSFRSIVSFSNVILCILRFLREVFTVTWWLHWSTRVCASGKQSE